MMLQVAVLVLALVAHSQAHYYFSNGGNQPQQARCSRASNPCRLKFDMYNLNGALIQSASSQVCSCNGGQDCLDDWTPSDRIISRNLRSNTMNVTLQMMFCNDVVPMEVCSPGNVSLEVSGFLLIPNELEEYYCRCNDDSTAEATVPLYLKERRVENNRFYHRYVCSNSWETCSNEPCMTVRQQKTTYNCKCPENMQCRTTGNWYSALIETQVYCSFR